MLKISSISAKTSKNAINLKNILFFENNVIKTTSGKKLNCFIKNTKHDIYELILKNEIKNNNFIYFEKKKKFF